MPWRQLALVAAFATLAVIAPVSPAEASCGSPPPYEEAIEQAAAVFVGEVVQLTNDRRWASVDVTQVWTGEVEVAERVELRAGPKDPPGGLSTITTVDRHYKLGRTYLFVPYKGSDSVFRDNACTRTSVYRAELDRFRPAGAVVASPTPGETEENDPSHEAPDRGISGFEWFVTGLFAVLMVALVVWANRHRSSKELGANRDR